MYVNDLQLKYEGGLLSGFAITSILGSLCNLLELYLAASLAKGVKATPAIRTYYNFLVFGDDTLIRSVSPSNNKELL